MVQGSLFSWITQACPWKLATRPFFIAWNRNHHVFHENMLPYICSFYDTGFKVAYIHGKRHDFYPMQWRNYADYESISLSLYSFTPCAIINFIVFDLIRSLIETTMIAMKFSYQNNTLKIVFQFFPFYHVLIDSWLLVFFSEKRGWM
jgi:hypothetical protein